MYEATKKRLADRDEMVDEWEFHFPLTRNTIPSQDDRNSVLNRVRKSIARKCQNGKPGSIKFGDNGDSTINVKSCDPTGIMKGEIDFFELGRGKNSRPFIGKLDIDVRETSRDRRFDFSILGTNGRAAGIPTDVPESIQQDLFEVFGLETPGKIGKTICMIVDNESIDINKALCVEGKNE